MFLCRLPLPVNRTPDQPLAAGTEFKSPLLQQSAMSMPCTCSANLRRFGVRFGYVRGWFIGVGRVVFQRSEFWSFWVARLYGVRAAAEIMEDLWKIL